jgi:ATP-dependent protease HslVU (ClpYQ) peptidase subunit
MTTIAYRDGVVAADTQMSESGCAYRTSKLHRIAGDIVAVSGEMYPAQRFLDWYAHREMTLDFSDDHQFECLIATAGGQVFTVDRNMAFLPVRLFRGGFYAIGSGRDFALAAMRCGKSAVDAVRIAAEFDTCTSTPIDQMKVG